MRCDAPLKGKVMAFFVEEVFERKIKKVDKKFGCMIKKLYFYRLKRKLNDL